MMVVSRGDHPPVRGFVSRQMGAGADARKLALACRP